MLNPDQVRQGMVPFIPACIAGGIGELSLRLAYGDQIDQNAHNAAIVKDLRAHDHALQEVNTQLVSVFPHGILQKGQQPSAAAQEVIAQNVATISRNQQTIAMTQAEHHSVPVTEGTAIFAPAIATFITVSVLRDQIVLRRRFRRRSSSGEA